MVHRPLMENMKVGQVILGEVIRKVTVSDAHTVCWVRMWYWISLKLYTKKVFGSLLLRCPSMLGWGAATPIFLDWVMSLTAVKIYPPMVSWATWSFASVSKGMASSVFSGSFCHSSSDSGSINAYAVSGWASWTGMVMFLLNFTSGSWFVLRLGFAWRLRFAAASTWSSCGREVLGSMVVSAGVWVTVAALVLLREFWLCALVDCVEGGVSLPWTPCPWGVAGISIAASSIWLILGCVEFLVVWARVGDAGGEGDSSSAMGGSGSGDGVGLWAWFG